MRGVPRPVLHFGQGPLALAGPLTALISFLTLVPQLTQSPIIAPIPTLSLNTSNEDIVLGYQTL